ncbi:hypothetical protein ABT282_15865 [Streptomyces sp. NPDC000927]|uniref:hypothetical protein n=1 Tax=Streptomyces sp. NPDC000927 TaxID=3154371 RepID=UPI00331D6575
MTTPADDARQGLEEITIGLDRVRTSLAGFFTNGVRAVEDQARRAADAERRAEQAEEAIDRVRRIHTRGLLTDACNDCGQPWPCEITRALDQQPAA